MSRYQIMAHWDAEASVWWAESADVPGLIAEADTMEALIGAVRELVPELLRLNLDRDDGPILLDFLADRAEELHPA
jgi:predicted RNase H-like HicB family nuclease